MKYFSIEFKRLYDSLEVFQNTVLKTKKFSDDLDLLIQQNNDFISLYESSYFDGSAKKKLDENSMPMIRENLNRISSNVSYLFSSFDIAFNKLFPLLGKVKEKDLFLENKYNELKSIYAVRDDTNFLFRTAVRYDEFGNETSYYLTQKEKMDKYNVDIANIELEIKEIEKELKELVYFCKNEIKNISKNTTSMKNIEIGNSTTF